MPAPDVDVDPTRIDFGALELGEARSEVVQVFNLGDDDLHVMGLELDAPDAPFEVGGIESVFIPAGRDTVFLASYVPELPGEHSARVLLRTDDPDEPVREVLLLGSAAGAALASSQDALDFGEVYVGCAARQSLTLRNVGDAPLELRALSVTGEGVSLVLDEPLPWVLEPEGRQRVALEYAPLSLLPLAGQLEAQSDGRALPPVSLSGQPLSHGERLEVFEQPPGVTDVLFALDTSCSMYDEVTELKEALPEFAALLDERGADFHVALYTDIDGCAHGPVSWIDLSVDEADHRPIFEAMMNPSSAQYAERPFMMFEAALSEERRAQGACNEALLRDEAPLALIAITDEREQSFEDYSTYVALMQSVKEDPAAVTFHGIAGPWPDGCSSARAATGLYEAITETGGQLLSICEPDLMPALEQLAAAASPERRRFPLSALPVLGTLSVRVDGATWDTGWTYEADENAVRFEVLPETGDTIELAYQVRGACEP